MGAARNAVNVPAAARPARLRPGARSVIYALLVCLGVLAWSLTAPPASSARSDAPPVNVAVLLAPVSIPANGSSSTTATVTVDIAGIGLSGQNVTITSSDPGESIGPVTDNGDGTYTATITSSTLAGPVTITGTDQDTMSSNSATLTQTPGAGANLSLSLSPTAIAADGKSTSTATATVTDTFGNPVPGDNVTITSSDAGEALTATVDKGDGTYTTTITSSVQPGPVTITADDSTANLTTTATLTQTHGPAANLSLQLSPTAIAADGKSTSTATATVTDASGNPVPGDTVTITSSDAGENVNTPHDNGHGSYTATITSSTTGGSPTIKATDTSAPGVSAEATLVQNASRTYLQVAPSSPVTNQSVELFAAVAPIPGTGSTSGPNGIVAFLNGASVISGCLTGITAQNPQATCETSFPASAPPGQLTAVFIPAPGTDVAGSSSTPVTISVGHDATTTSLDVSNPAVDVGTRATYTATVSPTESGSARPTGSVQFRDRGKPIKSCTSQPLAGGGAATATCKVRYPQPGTHRLTAVYSGDGDFSGSSTPSPQNLRVSNLATGTIASTMNWSFSFTPSYTKVSALIVHAAPAGASVIVKCQGSGCPYSQRSVAIARKRICNGAGKSAHCFTQTRRTVDLVGDFANRRLPVGTAISVEIVRPRWIGKYYLFRIMSGRAPRIRIACLGPGSSRPGVGC